jgi:hypothetical protein
MFWIDFESIQFFDIKYEISQFIVPEFMITNCESFFKGYMTEVRSKNFFDYVTDPVTDAPRRQRQG